MPSTRDIRRRIKSVTNTAKITRAMQMVASSKMARAQQAAVNGRPFAELAEEIESHVTFAAGDYVHPLMEERPVRKRAVVVISTDKGLCGALNANLLRETLRYDLNTTLFVAAGRKAAQFLGRTRRQLVAEFSYGDRPSYTEAHAIAHAVTDLFLKGEVDEVEVLFSRFVNTLTQRPETRPLLPIGSLESRRARRARVEAAGGPPLTLPGGTTEFIFEPAPADLLDFLFRYFLDFEIYQILLEAKASEHSARMVAMKNATDNANQLVKDLTLEYNKLRQANITKELLEIATAQMALG